MLDHKIALLEFVDAMSADDALAYVRIAEGRVGLALSLGQDGDVEVWLRPEDCDLVVAALQQALSEIRRPNE